MATGLGEGKLFIQTVVLWLKIDVVLNPTRVIMTIIIHNNNYSSNYDYIASS